MKTYRQDIFGSGLDEDSGPGLFIKCVGVFESLGNFYFEQVSPSYSFHFITEGEGIFEASGKKYNAAKGSLFIFKPGMHVKYYDFPEKPWKYTWLVLAGRDAEWIFEKHEMARTMPFFKDISLQFKNFIRKLLMDFRSSDFSFVYPVQAAWDCISFLSKTVVPETADFQNNSSFAQKCKVIIDSQKDGVASVDDLAAEFNIDRVTLFRVFKKAYGVSPKEYIDNFRFEKACALLKYSESSIKEIAYLCGFHKHDYFSGVFRKRFGSTPSEWRKFNKG